MIDITAKIGQNTTFGEYCVVESGVVIGDHCTIGHHVVIRRDTVIGSYVRIDDFASIGKQPMKAVNSALPKAPMHRGVNIGDGVIIGTSAVLYRGAVIGPECLVADLATIRENVNIGSQTIIGRGVAVENDCRVGRCSKLESNCYITAFSDIGDHCFIGPGVVTSNDHYAGRNKERYLYFKGVTVKKGGRIGVGAVILPGIVIGEDGFAAAGSVVTKDVAGGKVVMGVPAKERGDVPDNQLLKNQE